MINSPDSLAKPTVTNNYAPTPSLHLSMKLSLQRSRCVRYYDFHVRPACVCFINGSYSKSRGGGVRRGWGRLGLENRRISAQTGSLPVTHANDYRSLAVLGRSLVASIPNRLDLLSFPVRSSLACTLGNTEIPWLSPGYPDDPDDQLNPCISILPEQSKSLVSSTLSLVKLGCHLMRLQPHHYPSSLS